MTETCIISGITSQDGAYLSKLLLEKGYRVIGLVRSSNTANLKGLEYLGVKEKIKIEECDLLDITQLISLIRTYKPSQVYNLAAQSSVSLSFHQPIGTFHF